MPKTVDFKKLIPANIAVAWLNPNTLTLPDEVMYHPSGQTMTLVNLAGQNVDIVAEGDRRVVLADGTELSTSEEILAAFPSGDLPSDGEKGTEWLNNNWFSLYVGPERNLEDEPSFGLQEAIDHACSVLEAS